MLVRRNAFARLARLAGGPSSATQETEGSFVVRAVCRLLVVSLLRNVDVLIRRDIVCRPGRAFTGDFQEFGRFDLERFG